MFYKESIKNVFLLSKIQSPHCLFNRNVHFHCTKSKLPNNSSGSINFTLRLKKPGISTQLWGFILTRSTQPKDVKYSPAGHLYLTSIIRSPGFPVPLKSRSLRHWMFEWLSGCVVSSAGPEHLLTDKFQHPWTIPVMLGSSTAASWYLLAAVQSHLTISMEQAGPPCSKWIWSCQDREELHQMAHFINFVSS